MPSLLHHISALRNAQVSTENIGPPSPGNRNRRREQNSASDPGSLSKNRRGVARRRKAPGERAEEEEE